MIALDDTFDHDAFLSYATDDNILCDGVVDAFQTYFLPKLSAEIRRRQQLVGIADARLFRDKHGLPSNGDISVELKSAIRRSRFLVIFVGSAYLRSAWCGMELEIFSGRFNGDREEALRRTFVIVLEQEVVRQHWGQYLEEPHRPIYEALFDADTGAMVPPVLEGADGVAIQSPRFSRRLRKLAATMADRLMEDTKP